MSGRAADIARQAASRHKPPMRVRPFRPDDAPFLARIFHSAVHRIGRQYYSAEQIGAWAPAPPGPETFLRRGCDGRLLLVAVDDLDRPLAYGDLEADGHIDHLYCRPDMAGTGVAAFLYDRIEAAAVERGMGRLFVEASEPARRFFLKKGFVVLQRRDFELRNVPIHNFEMEKQLTKAPAQNPRRAEREGGQAESWPGAPENSDGMHRVRRREREG